MSDADAGHSYSAPIQALYPNGRSTPTKSDPHLVELQAMKQMLSAIVSQQDRLLTQLSTQQTTIANMEKKQAGMAFEIAELRRLNHAQYDQLLQIHQDTTETKRRQDDAAQKASETPVQTGPISTRSASGNTPGFGYFFANGLPAAAVIPYNPDFMMPHFPHPACCSHTHHHHGKNNPDPPDVANKADSAVVKPVLKTTASDLSVTTLIEPPVPSASSSQTSSRSHARRLPAIPPP